MLRFIKLWCHLNNKAQYYLTLDVVGYIYFLNVKHTHKVETSHNRTHYYSLEILTYALELYSWLDDFTFPCYQKLVSCFQWFWEKGLWSKTTLYCLKYKPGSGIAFYASFIQSRTMYVVQMERAWKDYSNHTKFSKSQNNQLAGF